MKNNDTGSKHLFQDVWNLYLLHNTPAQSWIRRAYSYLRLAWNR